MAIARAQSGRLHGVHLLAEGSHLPRHALHLLHTLIRQPVRPVLLHVLDSVQCETLKHLCGLLRQHSAAQQCLPLVLTLHPQQHRQHAHVRLVARANLRDYSVLDDAKHVDEHRLSLLSLAGRLVVLLCLGSPPLLLRGNRRLLHACLLREGIEEVHHVVIQRTRLTHLGQNVVEDSGALECRAEDDLELLLVPRVALPLLDIQEQLVHNLELVQLLLSHTLLEPRIHDGLVDGLIQERLHVDLVDVGGQRPLGGRLERTLWRLHHHLDHTRHARLLLLLIRHKVVRHPSSSSSSLRHLLHRHEHRPTPPHPPRGRPEREPEGRGAGGGERGAGGSPEGRRGARGREGGGLGEEEGGRGAGEEEEERLSVQQHRAGGAPVGWGRHRAGSLCIPRAPFLTKKHWRGSKI
mmetsp:Transcript_7942/g.19784  ORF Transcript_7942/g.19784 Transcript_7942/m.19784 type:complete len:408 (-) Transcript_7942:25-1248(-)